MLGPLRCLVVDPAIARDVVAPAYDSLTDAQRRAWADAHPRSWLNCIRGADGGSPAAERAAMVSNRRALEHILDTGTFRRHGRALYVYRMTDGDHRQTAIVGEVPTDIIGTEGLRVHEAVHERRVETLRLHIEIVGATSSPVAVTWRSDESVDDVLAGVTSGRAHIDVVDDDEVRQEMWSVDDDIAIAELTAGIGRRPLYIVDGHHRSAAAAAYAGRGEIRSEHDRHLLVAAFPMHHLRVAPFHRVVASAIDVGRLRTARRVDEPQLEVHATAVHDSEGRWWQVDLDGAPGDLDVERLHRSVLDEQLGIGADDPRIDHVAGGEDLDAFARRAAGSTGFALAPVAVPDVLDRADEGRLMPPKATYFHPKVRSGLLARLHVPGDESRVA